MKIFKAKRLLSFLLCFVIVLSTCWFSTMSGMAQQSITSASELFAEYGTVNSDNTVSWQKDNVAAGAVVSFSWDAAGTEVITNMVDNTNVADNLFDSNIATRMQLYVNGKESVKTAMYYMTVTLPKVAKADTFLLMSKNQYLDWAGGGLGLKKFEIYVSADRDTLYSSEAVATVDRPADDSGIWFAADLDGADIKYVGIKILENNSIPNGTFHSGTLWLDELAVLGTAASVAVSFSGGMPAEVGTVGEDGNITWKGTDLAQGIMPKLTKDAAGATEMPVMSEPKTSLDYISDSNSNTRAQVYIDGGAAASKEPPVYYLTFDLLASGTIDKLYIASGGNNANYILKSYDVFVSETRESLYNGTPVASVSRTTSDTAGSHTMELGGVSGRFVGIRINDTNQLTNGTWGCGMLMIYEFAVLGTSSSTGGQVKASYSEGLPSVYGSVDEGIFNWDESYTNLLKGVIPEITASASASAEEMMYFVHDGRPLVNITDGTNSAVTELILNANGNYKEEPSYPIFLTFDLGFEADISDIIINCNDDANHMYNLLEYDLYISSERDTLYDNAVCSVNRTGVTSIQRFHSFDINDTKGRYIGISIKNLNRLANGTWGCSLLCIRELAVLGKKTAEKELMGIRITQKPEVTNVVLGTQAPDLSGLTVAAYYSDGSIKELASDEYTLSGYSADTLGKNTVTVSYGGYSAEFELEIVKTSVTLYKTDKEVTDELVAQFGENLLANAKMQVLQANGDSMAQAFYPDNLGYCCRENLTNGIISEGGLEIARFVGTEESMPLSIIFDMRRSYSLNGLLLAGISGNNYNVSEYRVYVSNDRANLINEENLVLYYNNVPNFKVNSSAGTAQLFKLAGDIEGRYVAFVLEKNLCSFSYGYTRQFLTELGVYGTIDYGVETNLLPNTVLTVDIGGSSYTVSDEEKNIITDNVTTTEPNISIPANGKHVKFKYDLGGNKNITGFRVAGGSTASEKLIQQVKIYASLTEDTLFDPESHVYTYKRSETDTSHIIEYMLDSTTVYQYVAFEIVGGTDGSLLISEIAALGLSWQLNQRENQVFLSGNSSVKPYIQDIASGSIYAVDTFADRDTLSRPDLTSYLFDGIVGGKNTNIFGSMKGTQTANLVIDMEGTVSLDSIVFYGIQHKSLYNAKKIALYVAADENDLWVDAEPVAVVEDAERLGIMEAEFDETTGRFIRICILEGADESVCYGSEVTVISEINAYGVSFSENGNSYTPSFTDEETGISLTVNPLDYRDYYDVVTKMTVTESKADYLQTNSLYLSNLILKDGKYYKISLYDRNGNLVTDLGGRTVTVSIPVAQEDAESLIYLSSITKDSYKPLDVDLTEDRFVYTCEYNGALDFGLAVSYYYSDDEIAEIEKLLYPVEDDNGDESTDGDLGSSDDSIYDSDDNEITDGDAKEENNEDDGEKVLKRGVRKKKKNSTGGFNWLYIVIIVVIAVILICGGIFMLIFLKKRKKRRN